MAMSKDRKKQKNSWTEEEQAMLARLYSDRSLSIKEVAEKMQRSVAACMTMAHKMNIELRKRTWTDEQLDYLASHYRVLSCDEIAAALGKPVGSVCQKAHKLGLSDPNRQKLRNTTLNTEEAERTIRRKLGCMTRKDLAETLGVCDKTLNRKIQEMGLAGEACYRHVSRRKDPPRRVAEERKPRETRDVREDSPAKYRSCDYCRWREGLACRKPVAWVCSFWPGPKANGAGAAETWRFA